MTKPSIARSDFQGIFGVTYLYRTNSADEFFIKKVGQELAQRIAIYFTPEFREEFLKSCKHHKIPEPEIAEFSEESLREFISQNKIIIDNAAHMRLFKNSSQAVVDEALANAKVQIEKRADKELLVALKNSIYGELTATMREEFVALKIMNLLGLKTPTEISLIEEEGNNLLLLKRRVAQGEENKSIIDLSGESDTDADWRARRSFVIDSLDISDLGGNNFSQVRYKKHPEKLDRLIDFDPMLKMTSPPLPFERAMEYLSEEAGVGVEKFKKSLAKTAAYFAENKAEIFQTANLILDEARREKLITRLNYLGEMLDNITSSKSFKPYQAKAGDGEAYQAKKVESAFNEGELFEAMQSSPDFAGFAGRVIEYHKTPPLAPSLMLGSASSSQVASDRGDKGCCVVS